MNESMKSHRKYTCLVLLTLSLLGSLQNCSPKKATTATAAKEAPAPEFYSMDDFPKVAKYDVHVHIFTDDSTFFNQAKADNFYLLNVNVDSPGSPPVEQQQNYAVKQIKAFPQQVSYATAFSVKNFNKPDWQQHTIDYLKNSFANGAVGVKVWKNIGMALKDTHGKFVMIDDPRFDPVLDYIAANKITLHSHQGEPKNCWLPLDKMTVAGDSHYYSEHPQYHMYKHPEYPSYEDQINARDHMLEKHPDLKVVSVHLGSLEWNVDELAKRLDKYPNMAVDMAARISHLQYQAITNWQKVHDFCVKYQDRLLYGTDMEMDEKSDPAEVRKNVHETWVDDWKFFTTNDQMSNDSTATFKGLQLPREVVDKIYRENAQQWIPGIVKSKTS
jgi:hypothetical protein